MPQKMSQKTPHVLESDWLKKQLVNTSGRGSHSNEIVYELSFPTSLWNENATSFTVYIWFCIRELCNKGYKVELPHQGDSTSHLSLKVLAVMATKCLQLQYHENVVLPSDSNAFIMARKPVTTTEIQYPTWNNLLSKRVKFKIPDRYQNMQQICRYNFILLSC